MTDPCLSCGACCASFRVDFAVQELEGCGGRVPAGLAEPITEQLCRMRGSDYRSPRCAALTGKLSGVEFTTDPVFGFQVPKTCPDVPDHVLDPAGSWPNRDLYQQRYRQLAARFIENFKKFVTADAREVEMAGPKL